MATHFSTCSSLLALMFVGALFFLDPLPVAEAVPAGVRFRSILSKACLSASSTGKVSVIDCSADAHQFWQIFDGNKQKNSGTGQCLQVNSSMELFTEPCESEARSQVWEIFSGQTGTLKNPLTRGCISVTGRLMRCSYINPLIWERA